MENLHCTQKGRQKVCVYFPIFPFLFRVNNSKWKTQSIAGLNPFHQRSQLFTAFMAMVSVACMVCALAIGCSTDTEHVMMEFGGMGAAFYSHLAADLWSSGSCLILYCEDLWSLFQVRWLKSWWALWQWISLVLVGPKLRADKGMGRKQFLLRAIWDFLRCFLLTGQPKEDARAIHNSEASGVWPQWHSAVASCCPPATYSD